MDRIGFKAALIGTAILLGGCTFFDNALLPSLSGGKGGTSAKTATSSQTTGAETTGAQTTAAPTVGVTPGQATGTPVGQKVQELRGDLAKLQASVATQNQTAQTLRAQASQRNETYRQTVAAINSKLSAGTPPGNPELLKQWNTAQTQLDQINAALGPMIKLSDQISANASGANYLLASTRQANKIAGGVDEDQRQLHVLEDEVNRTASQIDRMQSDLTDEIARQTSFLDQERSNLNTLAFAINNGVALGNSLATRTYTAPNAPAGAPGSGIATGRPFVTIRFDRPNPDYKQALYQAMNEALARRPNAAFDLLAVAPNGGDPAQAQRNADEVRRSLISMGMSPDRINMSATTGPTASSNEVRLYIR